MIRPDELEEINASSIGNRVYGDCFLRKFKRLGIQIVEKQLIDNNIDDLQWRSKVFLSRGAKNI